MNGEKPQTNQQTLVAPEMQEHPSAVCESVVSQELAVYQKRVRDFVRQSVRSDEYYHP